MQHIKFLKNKYFLSLLLFIPYLFYLYFIIKSNHGPVDYETFMDIGHRFIDGEPIYITNSYYPLPYVMIFSVFSALPRAISMFIWLLTPVVCAWLISNKDPLVLLFAPLFGHFVGGQSSIFGMVGFWGYREYHKAQPILSAILLALTLLKPQLGVIPIVWAGLAWLKQFKQNRKIPREMAVFAFTIAVCYLPGFFILPNWMQQWLQMPRPIFERALAGFIPRTLLLLFDPSAIDYWIVLIILGLFLIGGIFWISKRSLQLDQVMLWGFMVSPLVHDYDLIQLIPLIDNRVKRVIAVLVSIPGWVVILISYSNNQAWYVFTIIPIGLLALNLFQLRCPKMLKDRDK